MSVGAIKPMGKNSGLNTQNFPFYNVLTALSVTQNHCEIVQQHFINQTSTFNEDDNEY